MAYLKVFAVEGGGRNPSFVGCNATTPQLLTSFTVLYLAQPKDEDFHNVSSLARELRACELLGLPLCAAA
jgi:hypothetical protein